MDNFTAIQICEGQQEAESEAQFFGAWQHLIDTGLAWQLQGYFGRVAASMIQSGMCVEPGHPSKGD